MRRRGDSGGRHPRAAANALANAAVAVASVLLVAAAHASDGNPGSEGKAGLPRENDQLNAGYSLLHEALSGMRWFDELLLVKLESKPLEAVIDEVSRVSSDLDKRLAAIAREYPAVEIDQDPLPVLERRKRELVNQDRLLSLTPLLGRSGEAFERTFLISTSGALHQTRHLFQVMAEIEPDPNLQAFLVEGERSFAHLYDDVFKLLSSHYFKHDSYERQAD